MTWPTNFKTIFRLLLSVSYWSVWKQEIGKEANHELVLDSWFETTDEDISRFFFQIYIARKLFFDSLIRKNFLKTSNLSKQKQWNSITCRTKCFFANLWWKLFETCKTSNILGIKYHWHYFSGRLSGQKYSLLYGQRFLEYIRYWRDWYPRILG